MLSTDKQTDRQTDKLTNATKNITFFAKEVMNIIASPQGELYRLHVILYYGPDIIQHIPIQNQWQLPQNYSQSGTYDEISGSLGRSLSMTTAMGVYTDGHCLLYLVFQ